MTTEAKFKMYQMVAMEVDGDKKGIITGILIRPNDIVYAVSFNDGERWCYEVEFKSLPYLSG